MIIFLYKYYTVGIKWSLIQLIEKEKYPFVVFWAAVKYQDCLQSVAQAVQPRVN